MIDLRSLTIFLKNFSEYLDPSDIKKVIYRNFGETDDEFRVRVLKKSKEMKQIG